MEVAEALGMNVGAVFVAGSKVRKLLREALERLDPHDESGGDPDAAEELPPSGGGGD